MLFMVIETFAEGQVAGIYARLAELGRMLPDGVVYVDSWAAADQTRCFQLMEAPEERLIREWTRRWDDLVSFEIVPVIPSLAMQAQHAVSKKGGERMISVAGDARALRTSARPLFAGARGKPSETRRRLSGHGP